MTKGSALKIDPAWLKVRLDSSGKLDISGMEKFFAGLVAAHPELDYTEALESLGASKYASGDDSKYPECVKLAKLASDSDLLAEFQNKKFKLEADYFEMQAKTGAIPYFEPGAELSKDMNWLRAEVIKDLGNDCDISRLVFPLAKIFLEEVGKASSKFTEACRSKLAEGYRHFLAKSQVDPEGCVMHQAACDKRMKQVRETAAYLESVGIPVVSEKLTKDFQQAAKDVCLMPANALMVSLGAVSDSFLKVTECKPLEVGKSRVINGNNGTFLPATYKLSRAAEKEYKVSFNLDFILPKAGLLDKSIPVDAATREAMLRQVKSCFAKVNGHLRAGGVNLLLAIESPPPKKDSEDYFSNTIEIDPANPREDSNHWSGEKMACETIVHELLHLTGLIDEYKERWIGTVVDNAGEPIKTKDVHGHEGSQAEFADFDCRSAGPYNSMMANQHKLFEQYFPDALLQCECPGRDEKCAKAFAALSEDFQDYLRSDDALRKKEVIGPVTNYTKLTFEQIAKDWKCPNGKPAKARRVSGLRGDAWRKQAGSYETKDGRKILVLNPPPASLLLPAQMRVITMPGCRAENKLYYQCSVPAYKTTRGHNGLGGCGYLPEECSQPEEWLK